jgi:fibronectin type 3 domain-containing protein
MFRFRLPRFARATARAGLGALAALILSGTVNAAQPTLQLRFAFDDSSGTTTPSDTSGGGANVTLQMLNKTAGSTNLHGVANSGVAGLTNPNRALDLSSNPSQGGNGNFAAVTNASLGFGSVSSFVATMWMKQSVALPGNIGGRMFLLGNSTNTDVGTANSIGMKWQVYNQLFFYVNTVQCAATIPTADTNGWIFVAMVYDGSNVTLYEGTDKTPAVALSTNATAGQIVPLPTTSASLFLGNRLARDRDFAGWIDDFRFYTGTGGTAAFVESVRQAAAGPAGLVAVPNDSQVTLTWTALSGAASYNVKRSTTSGGPYSTISTAGTVTTPSYTDSTAVNGTTYYYVVSAVNGSAVESANSPTEASATPSVPPPAPMNLNATAGTGQVGLTWAPSTGAANYNIKRATTSLAEVTMTNVATTSFTDKAVVNGVPYYYVVSAVNATRAESGNSSEATATPVGPPPAPTGLTAFATGIGQVGVSWSASLLATSYNVYRATASAGTYIKISTDGTVTTTGYTDPTASGSAPYFYEVSAVNSYGEGPLSGPASAAPLAARLRFDFSDTGTTTVDSISGVSLNIVNSNNVATDYHGAVNSGVAGAGKSLDFSVNAYNSPTNVGGPLASTVMNTTLNSANFGSISNFTLTFWVKPDTDFYTSPDIVNINNPRLALLAPANYVDYPAAVPSTQPGLYVKINSFDTGPENGQLKVFLGSGTSAPEYVTPTGSFVSAPGLWSFVAITYDGAALKVYTATQTNTASSLILNALTSNQALNFTTNGNLLLCNRGDLKKSVDGWMTDFRFYSGAASSNCVENIRSLAANPPTGFTATGGSNQVSLSWAAYGAATSYNIKRAGASSGPYTTISTPGSVTGTSFTDSTAINNTTYYYVLSAATPYGESANSAEASAPASCTPPPTTGNNGPVCAGSTLNLTASLVPGATYNWTGPNGFTSTDQNPSIPNATTAASGVYGVTVTVGACTSVAATTTATVNAIPNAPVAGNNGPICAGSTLNLTASNVPGATYSWTGPNGFTSGAQNPSIASATADATGLYSVTATVNGCTSLAGTTTAAVNAIPAAPVAGNNSPITAGSTLSLTASTVPGATYSWTGPNGFTSIQQNPSIMNATTNASGLYSVTATVGICTSPAGTTTVTVNPLLLVTLSIEASSGSVTIGWPGGTLQSATNVVGPWDDVTNAVPPSYQVTPTDPQQFFRVKVQ